MKRFIALLLVITAAALSLAGCGSAETEIPSGMQLVRGGDELGYYLYSPLGWIVSSQGNIAASYVSSIDTTSVTLVEADMPEGSIEEYFEAARADFTFDINLTVSGTEFKLGNAEEAKQYIYDYEYSPSGSADGSKYKFRTMQIFAKFDGSFYIFTFTAQLAKFRDEKTYYDYHLENSLKSITDNLKFVKKSGSPSLPEYPEVNGYLLISKRELCGFNLYVPKDYAVDFSDGIVSATREDGSNVTVSKSTAGGVDIRTYWEIRRGELESIVGTVTEIKVNNQEGVKLGNLTKVASYEYTYSLAGVSYHVYQVFGVNAFDGYAFTFTAPEEVFAERIGEALSIAEMIEF